MVETPTGDPGEAFGVLDALIGATPFLILAGIVAAFVAAAFTYPVVARTGVGFRPGDRSAGRYLAVPALLGAVGLPLSVWIAVVVGGDPQFEPVWRTFGRTVLVVAGLATASWVVQFRETDAASERTGLAVYATFVVVWAALVTALWVTV